MQQSFTKTHWVFVAVDAFRIRGLKYKVHCQRTLNPSGFLDVLESSQRQQIQIVQRSSISISKNYYSHDIMLQVQNTCYVVKMVLLHRSHLRSKYCLQILHTSVPLTMFIGHVLCIEQTSCKIMHFLCGGSSRFLRIRYAYDLPLFSLSRNDRRIMNSTVYTMMSSPLIQRQPFVVNHRALNRAN